MTALDRSKFREQWAQAVDVASQVLICREHRQELIFTSATATQGSGVLLACPEEGCKVVAELVTKESD